ncbi:unnamed protein product [Cylicostephanus goldi]|uniref:Uncharacterized protein n=1 Tax=Cylicostephanus goldi TaxID=71465 RepID=A0A3P7PH23_CYLGO|nr:unnamed protein product [Cylicostephanus goldi]
MGSSTTTSEARKKQPHRFLTRAEKDALRRSEETQVARDLRLAADVERAALRKSNETEGERKLRLSVNAERTRLRRLAETEESRADRLAGNAERSRKKRATAAVEKRQMGEENCVPSTSNLDNSELVENFSGAAFSHLSNNTATEEVAAESHLTSFERSDQESINTILVHRIMRISQMESELDSTVNESNFLETPVSASTMLKEDLPAQVNPATKLLGTSSNAALNPRL